jgi:hypothetical protein
LTSHVLRRAGPLAAAVAVFLVSVQPAAAFTILTSSSPGQFAIDDTSAQPSVRCVIDDLDKSTPIPEDVGTVKIKIYPPKMYGKANASKVSWIFLIRRNEDPFYPGWTTKYTSSAQVDTATVSTAANSFSARTYVVPKNGSPDEIYTVRFIMTWRNNSNVVKGYAAVELAWYRETGPYGSGDIYQLPCQRITGSI